MPGRKPSARGSRPFGLGGRGRRLRRTPALRHWVAETNVEIRRLVYPVFVRPGHGGPTPVPSMPGVESHTVRDLPRLAHQLDAERIRSVLLFGLGAKKDAEGSEAWSEGGIVPGAVRALKHAAPGLIVVTDVCLCAYTSDGHCGVMRNGSVENDLSCERLGRVAVAHANAGADVVAPSAMMDGQVRWVRSALDEAGRAETAILAYSSKHASAFYGPFREVEQSTPAFGDRAGYQMDFRNGREALLRMEVDAAEGADILMVKPGLTSLDILARARERFLLPLAAYQVSGEYAMLKAAAERGILEERPAVEETLGAMRRAGADLIITYFARDVARWSNEDP